MILKNNFLAFRIEKWQHPVGKMLRELRETRKTPKEVSACINYIGFALDPARR